MTRRRRLLLAAFACLLMAGPFVVRWATTPAVVPGVTVNGEPIENLPYYQPSVIETIRLWLGL